MSTSSQVSLGALRLQAQQRSDMEGNPFISTSEWNSFINASYKKLYNILASAYGNDYYVAKPYPFTTTSAQNYALPDGSPSYRDADGNQLPKFYKLLGLDLQYSASPTGYVTLQRYEFIERNKYAYPNTATNFNGYTNLKYRLQGDEIYLIPIPMGSQNLRAWYIPAPTNLQFVLPCSTTANSSTISLTDTTGLTAGMSVADSPEGTYIPTGTVISSVASTSVVLSNAVTLTKSSMIVSFWNDSTLLEGIAGFEEVVILGSAIKAMIKQESDYQGLADQYNEAVKDIESLAEGRDAGQAHHVSDAMSVNSYGGYQGSDSGFGSGGLF